MANEVDAAGIFGRRKIDAFIWEEFIAGQKHTREFVNNWPGICEANRKEIEKNIAAQIASVRQEGKTWKKWLLTAAVGWALTAIGWLINMLYNTQNFMHRTQ